MPILVLKDRYEIIITKEQEVEVNNWLDSDDDIIRINSNPISKSVFSYIKPGGYTAVDMPQPIDRSRRLSADNRPDEEQYQSARQKAETIKDIVKRRDWSKLKKGKRGSQNARG